MDRKDIQVLSLLFVKTKVSLFKRGRKSEDVGEEAIILSPSPYGHSLKFSSTGPPPALARGVAADTVDTPSPDKARPVPANCRNERREGAATVT